MTSELKKLILKKSLQFSQKTLYIVVPYVNEIQYIVFLKKS